MEELSTLVHKVKRVSSLPAIFLKVNELINDPTSSATDLGQVIEKDQALTSRLLRLANSAFYGFPGKIETVSRAVSIIGFKQLQELVLAMSVRSMFSGFGRNSPINMHSFWQHSIACGIASRTLAILKGVKTPESYFVAGFLHDLGRLILLEHYPEKYADAFEVANRESTLLYDVERDVFGFSHADVGGELIKNWRLPVALAEAVSFHHYPWQAKEYPDLTAVVHVANIAVHAWSFGFSGDELLPAFSREAWELTGLKVSALEPALAKVTDQYEELSGFLTPN